MIGSEVVSNSLTKVFHTSARIRIPPTSGVSESAHSLKHVCSITCTLQLLLLLLLVTPVQRSVKLGKSLQRWRCANPKQVGGAKPRRTTRVYPFLCSGRPKGVLSPFFLYIKSTDKSSRLVSSPAPHVLCHPRHPSHPSSFLALFSRDYSHRQWSSRLLYRDIWQHHLPFSLRFILWSYSRRKPQLARAFLSKGKVQRVSPGSALL